MRSLAQLPFRSVTLTSTAPYHYFHHGAWTWDHTLQDFDLWVVCRGSGELQIDGRPVAIEAPQAFLFRPGQRVLGSKDPGVRLEILTLHFTTDAPVGTAARRLAPLNGLRLPHATFVTDAFEQLIEIAHLRDPLAQQQAAALALFILGELSRLQQTRGRALVDDRFAQLVRSIRHHPEHGWSVPQLAQAAGMSATVLNVRFREYTGLSPMKYVIAHRMQKACTLLEATPLRVEQVAEATGYRDVFFFSRQFKQMMHETPTTYRRRRAASGAAVAGWRNADHGTATR